LGNPTAAQSIPQNKSLLGAWLKAHKKWLSIAGGFIAITAYVSKEILQSRILCLAKTLSVSAFNNLWRCHSQTNCDSAQAFYTRSD
jgi:hypothetical protein